VCPGATREGCGERLRLCLLALLQRGLGIRPKIEFEAVSGERGLNVGTQRRKGLLEKGKDMHWCVTD